MVFKYFEWMHLFWQMKHYQKVENYPGASPRQDKLYQFFPEGAFCSDGSRYHALFRKGKENNLIIVLDGGRIAAAGTHEELLATSKIYQEIYQSQQEGVGE